MNCGNIIGDVDGDAMDGACISYIPERSPTGHGNLTPRTSEGKVVTMLYALVGVPLMLMCLSSLGGFLAEALQCSYGRLCGGGSRSDSGNDTNGGNTNGSSVKRISKNNVAGGDGTKMIEQLHIKHSDDNEVSVLLIIDILVCDGAAFPAKFPLFELHEICADKFLLCKFGWCRRCEKCNVCTYNDKHFTQQTPTNNTTLFVICSYIVHTNNNNNKYNHRIYAHAH